MKTLSDAALRALSIMTFKIPNDLDEETYNAIMDQIIGVAYDAGKRIAVVKRTKNVTFVQVSS